MYTSGIILPKLPSTPTTDNSDEITEREPFDKPQTFRRTPDPYLHNLRYNNEGDAEDSDTMPEVRQHNRDRAAKIQSELKKVRDYGTQSEAKSTRNIGTMSEPVKTRNAGNEVQPQSSATQTSSLLQQQQRQLPYDGTQQDETDLRPSKSQRSRYDSRTNGYYPSQHSTPPDHRHRCVPSSSISPRQRDYSDYDQHEAPYLSQYNGDPHDQYTITRNDYQRSTSHRPYSDSQTRQRIPSPTNFHRTPPPPVEYRSTPLNDRYRTVSPSDHYRYTQPQRSRSPSPPDQKYIQTPTSRQRTVSPLSQRRSRPTERSPPPSRHHISSSTKLHHTPSPPVEYRSTSPHDRHRPPSSTPANYSRKTKDRPRMVSTETDTSLDGMKPQQHRGVQPEPPSTREYGITTNGEKKYSPQASQSPNRNTRSPYSQYQTLNSSLPKRQDYITISPYHDNYKVLRDDQSPSTRKNYRLRPVQNDFYADNYEEIPTKHDGYISPEYNRSFDRPKEYISKPFTGDHYQRTSPTAEPRSDEEEQNITVNLNEEIPNEEYMNELPSGGSISIRSTTVIQPDTLPRSYGQNKSPRHQKYDRVDNRTKITESPLHHSVQRINSVHDSPVLNIGTEKIIYQSPDNEFTVPFKTRYIRDLNDGSNEFTTNNNSIRSSTLKRDDLRSRSNRILLLPVINSARTYVFEKQVLPANYIRQSRTNGNFYLATSPPLRSLNSSFQIDNPEFDPLTQTTDSTNLHGHGLRSQVV